MNAVIVLDILDRISEERIEGILKKTLGTQNIIRNLMVQTNANGKGSRYARFEVLGRASNPASGPAAHQYKLDFV